jgi:Bifunctional DNA primase/polymerase, N-terminal
VNDLVKEYRRNGWAPLPYARGAKAPRFEGWQDFVADDSTRFDGNVGLLLGEKSRGLVDVDLDCAEALKLAPDILPPTSAIFGRRSKPNSHRLYLCDEPPERTVQFQFDKGMIVELRSNGGQTMAPPSVHPSGEKVEWTNGGIGMPAKVPAGDLAGAVGDLAGLSLLIRNWPDLQGRYNAEGALIGALLRAGRPAGDVERLIKAVQKHAGAPRDHQPDKSVQRLAAMLAEGKPVPGLRRLGELFGAPIAAKVADWMRLRRAGTAYEERADGIYWMMRKEKNEAVEIIPVKLCNFTAAITEVVVRDDGSGLAERAFVLTGSPGRAEVPAADFDAMTWVTAEWGPHASVEPGVAIKPRLAHALKTLSDEAAERVVYTHTGWRQVDGRWLYLHAGGAIGADGPVSDVAVELDGELAHMALPAVADLPAAVRASLGLLDLDATIAAATWRAPLVEFLQVAFSAYLAGPTGALKSALLGVAQAHWGARWNGVRFPANWSGTVNSIEKLAFLAKDLLLVIDDFAPSGSRRAVTELHEKAERLLRGAGNLAGRSRMHADTSLRPTYWPRGLLASSGEDVPAGHSLRARMAIEQVGANTIDPARLRTLQDAARAGLLAEAMAGYVQFLAGMPDLGEVVERQQAKLRGLIAGEHRRTPDTVASLALGVDMFLAFAVAAGAIDEADREVRWEAAWRGFCAAATAQGDEQREEDPVRVFVEAIPEVLAAGMAHVAGRDGEVPQDGDPAALGWRKRSSPLYEQKDRETTDVGLTHQPVGNRIGWIEGEQLWLAPAASLSAVAQLIRAQGKVIPIGAVTLGKRLRDAGWLTRLGSSGSPTATVKLSGATQRVWVMARRRVLDKTTDEPIPF